MTVGELKTYLADKSDDVLVLVYDREDFMYTPDVSSISVSPHHIIPDTYVEKYENAPIVRDAVILS